MRFRFPALVATLALIMACGTEPEPPDRPRIELTSKRPFTSQSMVEFKVVDAGSSYMKRLVKNVTLERRHGIAMETDVWKADGQPAVSDIYLTAARPADIEHHVADDPSLAVPLGRALAFGRVENNRWRTYLVEATPALDTSSIAHAEVRRDAETGRALLSVDFDAVGAAQFHDVTARTVGQKLAVLVDGRVIAAPVIASVISGGRAEVTFDDGASR